MTARESLFSFRRRKVADPPSQPTEEPPVPRFVCRTCGKPGPFYVAQQVTNWNAIGVPYRQPNGSLTYRVYASYLPGTPGPALAYSCGSCRTSCATLEELVLEPAFVEAEAE